MSHEIPIYLEHEGTVRVSGKSEVGKVGKYLTHIFNTSPAVVDVLFIGANAGQQAYKAISIACQCMEREGVYLGFYPLRFQTETDKQDALGNLIMGADGQPAKELKDCSVWRLIDISELRKPNGKTETAKAPSAP